jgi:indolepyruvate decarboxylase
MILAKALLKALKDYGASQIFGIPGNYILAFFKEIESSEILPLYTLSHEPAVGFAADAAARIGNARSRPCASWGFCFHQSRAAGEG